MFDGSLIIIYFLSSKLKPRYLKDIHFSGTAIKLLLELPNINKIQKYSKVSYKQLISSGKPWSRGRTFTPHPDGPGSNPAYSSFSSTSRIKKYAILVTSLWKSRKEKKMTQPKPRPKWQWEMSVLLSMLINNVCQINKRDHRNVIQHFEKKIQKTKTIDLLNVISK